MVGPVLQPGELQYIALVVTVYGYGKFGEFCASIRSPKKAGLGQIYKSKVFFFHRCVENFSRSFCKKNYRFFGDFLGLN